MKKYLLVSAIAFVLIPAAALAFNSNHCQDNHGHDCEEPSPTPSPSPTFTPSPSPTPTVTETPSSEPSTTPDSGPNATGVDSTIASPQPMTGGSCIFGQGYACELDIWKIVCMLNGWPEDTSIALFQSIRGF